ncbi:MAG TPA: hypothetical protein VD948_09890, partial [Rhodothermales bacterium]|nr:hypothetical protein [Rhodothermales bacterium]
MRALSASRPARVLLTLMLLAPAALAQPRRPNQDSLPRYRFQRLSVADGLPDNAPYAPLQDRRGFLWFGSGSGLVRYDGREAKVFRQRSASGRVSLRSVGALIEDARGDLWAGGYGESGLWRLDRRTERWTSYEHDPRRPITLSSNDIYDIIEAAPGRLLVFTASPSNSQITCLDRLDVRSGRVRRFRWRKNSPNAPEGHCIATLAVFKPAWDARGGTWFSSVLGLLRYDPRGDSLQLVAAADVVPYGDARYRALDPLLRAARPLAQIQQPGHYANLTVPFQLDHATRVLVVGGGEMSNSWRADYGWIENARGDTVWAMRHGTSAWMGGYATNRLVVAAPTLPAGRYRLRFKTDSNQGPEEWNWTPPDREDLWGIRVVEAPSSSSAQLARLETRALTRRPDQLPHAATRPLGDDGRGGLLIAGHGLLRRDHRTGRVEDLAAGAGPVGLPDSLQLRRAYIYSTFATSDGVLWLGTYQGLYRLQHGRATRYSFDPSPASRFNSVWQILGEDDGTLWLTVEGRAVHFDPATGRFQTYRLDIGAQSGFIVHTSMLRDRQGNVWVAVPSSGLYRLDRTAGRTTSWQHRAGDAGSLPSNVVQHLTRTPDGAVWASTESGLVRFDPTMRTLRRMGAQRYS